MIAFYGLSDTGCVRTDNEDRILLDERLSLFAVADGMGGHSYGEVAAELALATIRLYVQSSDHRSDVTWPFGYNPGLSIDENRLLTAVRLANRRVWERSEGSPEYAGMGTTVVAVLITGNKAAIASVGDSRLYLLRRSLFGSLTYDDTWVAAMVRQGTLHSSEVASHPMRNVLTQAAGAREEIDIQILEHELADGDMLLLSTDGLHGQVEEETIHSILSKQAGKTSDLRQTAAQLIQAVRERGAPDNASCILLRYTA